MSTIEVRPDPKHPDRGWLAFAYRIVPCRLGRHGVSADKREGDGKTPVGQFSLRRALYRADRIGALSSGLQIAPIRRDDGWCDDPQDGAYNKPVRLPHSSSAEAL
ncbi:MAG: hypothetical protein FJX59_01370, partial [Alphaproteobacteria bacterium]|nr:hypothetical protein [Alphaproteobacteria bacterium]